MFRRCNEIYSSCLSPASDNNDNHDIAPPLCRLAAPPCRLSGRIRFQSWPLGVAVAGKDRKWDAQPFCATLCFDDSCVNLRHFVSLRSYLGNFCFKWMRRRTLTDSPENFRILGTLGGRSAFCSVRISPLDGPICDGLRIVDEPLFCNGFAGFSPRRPP